MALMWWEKGLWHICMCHHTEHGKVDFPKFPPGTWLGGWGYIAQLLILNSEIKVKIFPMSGGVHSTTFHVELRNERFTLIYFMGFPTILSTLQPFQICIFNRTYSKLTYSNGPHVMGKRFMAHLHASPYRTWKSRFSQISTRSPGGGVHSTTVHVELRNERFTLICFMGFPAILSTLQPFQICVFNRT